MALAHAPRNCDQQSRNMTTQPEPRIIEQCLSLVSRTGMFAFDWNPITKRLSQSSSWWKRASACFFAVSSPVQVWFELQAVVHMSQSEDPILSQGLRIVVFFFFPVFCLMSAWNAIILRKRMEVAHLCNQIQFQSRNQLGMSHFGDRNLGIARPAQVCTLYVCVTNLQKTDLDFKHGIVPL